MPVTPNPKPNPKAPDAVDRPGTARGPVTSFVNPPLVASLSPSCFSAACSSACS
jgi:hypothetical protein